MNTTLKDTIERQITVRAPKERVFNAIADPTQIIKWFPDAVEGTLAIGERPIFDFGEYGKSQIYVEAVDPFDYFAYRWIPGSVTGYENFRGDVLTVPNTLVEFRLKETSDGTTVTLTESGFASLPTEVYAAAFKDNNEGWDYMLGRLAKLMAEA
jgi:uncharacterized protein YndB with AHSA1/START domain